MTEDSSSEYCCAPASACTENQEGTSCSSGEVLSFYSTVPCNATGRCYNDFFASEHLTRFAHYTCQDKCINWEDMCRGVSFCAGDEKACGPSLRCPYGTTQYNMSTIPVRYYCLDNDFSEKKIMAPMTSSTGLMRISLCPKSPAPRVSTTQLWPIALMVTMVRVSSVRVTANTLLPGVMTSLRDIVMTPECGLQLVECG